MVLIKINGVNFPAPDEYKMETEPLGKFERNANGSLVGDLIAVKKKISCEWKLLEGRYYSELMAAVSPLFVNLEFILPDGGADNTDMYTVIQSGKLAFRKAGENFWKGVSCSFIER